MISYKKIIPRSLKFKILFLLFSGIILSVAISFYIDVNDSKRWLQEDSKKNLKIVSSAIYSILEYTMAKGELEEVPFALKNLTRNPMITDIQLLDRDMNPRFVSRRDGSVREKKVVMMAIRPRTVCKKCHGKTDPIGYLRIGFDISEYRKRLTEEIFRNLGVSLLLLMSIFVFVFICLEKGIFSRLKMINTAMKSFGSGNLRERVQLKGEDELGEMAKVFNEMAGNIYRINYRLFKVSEFSTFIYRKRTEEEVFYETVRFLKKIFSLNGVAIFLNEPAEERLITYMGELSGLIYNEPLVVDMKEVGTIKVSVSRDMTVDELSALSLIASAASAAVERIRQSRGTR